MRKTGRADWKGHKASKELEWLQSKEVTADKRYVHRAQTEGWPPRRHSVSNLYVTNLPSDIPSSSFTETYSILAALAQTCSPPGPLPARPCRLCSLSSASLGWVWRLSSFPSMAALSLLPPSLVSCLQILKILHLSPPSPWLWQLYLPTKINWSRVPQRFARRRADSRVILATQINILKAALGQTHYKPGSQI